MIKKIILVLILSTSVSCAQKVAAPLTAEVNVINEDANKTIELRSIGFGGNLKEAMYDAEKKAFEILFFRGIPNTAIEKPLVGPNENELLAKHSGYFKQFFDTRYKSFIMSVYQSAPSRRKKGIVSSVNDLKINVLALKKDLETNNIIRKFGF